MQFSGVLFAPPSQGGSIARAIEVYGQMLMVSTLVGTISGSGVVTDRLGVGNNFDALTPP